MFLKTQAPNVEWRREAMLLHLLAEDKELKFTLFNWSCFAVEAKKH